jgi:hypothetical protein
MESYRRDSEQIANFVQRREIARRSNISPLLFRDRVVRNFRAFYGI